LVGGVLNFVSGLTPNWILNDIMSTVKLRVENEAIQEHGYFVLENRVRHCTTEFAKGTGMMRVMPIILAAQNGRPLNAELQRSIRAVFARHQSTLRS
jgi:hypothetical protein